MTYDPERHHRRSIRLHEYDYAQEGAYFVTICARNRKCLFGEVTDGEMTMNAWGQIVYDEWVKSAEIRKEIQLDVFVVMPNHIHGIVVITRDEDGRKHDRVGATGRSPLRQPNNAPRGPAKRSLGSFIAGFKPAVTKRINEIRGAPRAPIWQRNYHEHIIRNETSLNRIRQYIIENPLRWDTDRENPAATRRDLEHEWDI
jgi:REP element-mobilizing transposase RayT